MSFDQEMQSMRDAAGSWQKRHGHLPSLGLGWILAGHEARPAISDLDDASFTIPDSNSPSSMDLDL